MEKTFQEILYSDLMSLVKNSNGSFIIKDYPIENNPNQLFRIFTYDLPKYSEFLQPNAKNCRGTMFFIDNDKIQLIALPMKKFFSLGEGPESNKLKITDAAYAYLKIDGSLLTSYICPIESILKFKSKNMPTYLEYDLVKQSIPENLWKELFALTSTGVSVDLEMTTPKNRVILEYSNYTVNVLKARKLEDGMDVDIRSTAFAKEYPIISNYLVKSLDPKKFDMNSKEVEGCVLEMADGTMYKVKTIPYLKMVLVIGGQDRTKDQEYIYAATLHEVIDEIRSLYHYRNHSPDFPIERILANIDKVEAYAIKTYRSLIENVDTFYEENKHLNRKDYAFKAKEKIGFTSVLMQKYLGQKIDYKQLAISMYAKKKIPE